MLLVVVHQNGGSAGHPRPPVIVVPAIARLPPPVLLLPTPVDRPDVLGVRNLLHRRIADDTRAHRLPLEALEAVPPHVLDRAVQPPREDVLNLSHDHRARSTYDAC